MSCYTDIQLLAHATQGKDTQTLILRELPDGMIFYQGGILQFLIEEVRDRMDCIECKLIECCEPPVPPVIDYGSQVMLQTTDTSEVNTIGPNPVVWDEETVTHEEYELYTGMSGTTGYTVSVTGRYRIDSLLTFQSATTGVSVAVQIGVNGVPVPYGIGRQGVITGGLNSRSSSSVGIVVDLMDGDYVESLSFQNGVAGSASLVAMESNLIIQRFPQSV